MLPCATTCETKPIAASPRALSNTILNKIFWGVFLFYKLENKSEEWWFQSMKATEKSVFGLSERM